MLTTTIQLHTPECVVATCGPVLLIDWQGGGSGDAIKTVHRVSVELGRAHPRGIAHVNLIGSGRMVSGISEDIRAEIVAILRDRSVPLVATAVVLPGEGFISAFVRSILAGAVLLGRSKAVFRFVATVREAEACLREPGRVADALRLPPGVLEGAVKVLRNPGREAAVA